MISVQPVSLPVTDTPPAMSKSDSVGTEFPHRERVLSCLHLVVYK